MQVSLSLEYSIEYKYLGISDWFGYVCMKLSTEMYEGCFVLAELAEIFFVDTTPFVNMYFTNTEDHTYDWRGVPSRKAYIQTLLKV